MYGNRAARYDGAQLENLVTRANTASGVWADTAYRFARNESWLARRGFLTYSQTQAQG